MHRKDGAKAVEFYELVVLSTFSLLSFLSLFLALELPPLLKLRATKHENSHTKPTTSCFDEKLAQKLFVSFMKWCLLSTFIRSASSKKPPSTFAAKSDSDTALGNAGNSLTMFTGNGKGSEKI